MNNFKFDHILIGKSAIQDLCEIQYHSYLERLHTLITGYNLELWHKDALASDMFKFKIQECFHDLKSVIKECQENAK